MPRSWAGLSMPARLSRLLGHSGSRACVVDLSPGPNLPPARSEPPPLTAPAPPQPLHARTHPSHLSLPEPGTRSDRPRPLSATLRTRLPVAVPKRGPSSRPREARPADQAGQANVSAL